MTTDDGDPVEPPLRVEVVEDRSGRIWAMATACIGMGLAAVAMLTVLSTSIGRLREREDLNDRIEELSAQVTAQHAAEDCLTAYGRQIVRAQDELNKAEANVFSALLGGASADQLQTAIDGYRTAVDGFTAMVDARDEYVKAGQPLPCPIT